jgi:3-dehydroquinate synthase
VIGMGGGALLDVAGLAAATAHRGVRHVRVPTTV